MKGCAKEEQLPCRIIWIQTDMRQFYYVTY